MWHKGTGRLIYDPRREGLKKKKEGWCVVLIDRDIPRYYREWVKRALHIKGLVMPSWGAHISVVRGEGKFIKDQRRWKKDHGKIIQFRYEHNPRVQDIEGGGQFWFIDVLSDELVDIRKELGLKVHYKFHITIARRWF